MTPQGAIREALQRPISDMGKFVITRQGQRTTCCALFLGTTENGVEVFDMETSQPEALLSIAEIMAQDWVLEERELRA